MKTFNNKQMRASCARTTFRHLISSWKIACLAGSKVNFEETT
jgi:hypothetical protein